MPQFESLYYETKGDPKKPSIVFLHGFLGSGKSWNEIISNLSKSFFCITVDLPGHGKTLPALDENYTIVNCANAIVRLLDELKTGEFHLVGYSMGGRLALNLAFNHPDRIVKLVLESSSPGLKTEKERDERRKSDEQLARRLENRPLAEFLEKWYNQPLFESLRGDKIRFKSLLDERQSNNTNGLAKSLRQMGTGAQEPLWDKLPKLSVSTLLIVGELDSKFQGIADQMSVMNKNIQIACVNDAGHNVHFEKPDAFAELLHNFFK